ncbi:MAG: NADH-quinone oxidoreductase subunit J, partial [Dolichospermum sp.]
NSIVVIGEHLFSDFLLPFELASVLLLIAMVGAIILARREYLPDQLPTSGLPQTILTLPERPKELISTGSSSNN